MVNLVTTRVLPSVCRNTRTNKRKVKENIGLFSSISRFYDYPQLYSVTLSQFNMCCARSAPALKLKLRAIKQMTVSLYCKHSDLLFS